jgi:hypothetical protein
MKHAKKMPEAKIRSHMLFARVSHMDQEGADIQVSDGVPSRLKKKQGEPK